MDHSQHRIELANRLLSYHEYGDPDGKPLLYFHNFPSSGVEAAYLDSAAHERGIRVISPDRPGMGGSSMSPNRRIVHWPRDMSVLLDRLNIEKAAVLGFGAGAPYAFACGNSISRRVSAIGICSGVVPARSHMKATSKAFAALAMLPLNKRRLMDAERTERLWQRKFEGANENEAAVATNIDFRRPILAALANSFTEGTGGAAKDYALTAGANWGFAMGNVSVDKIIVWHGDADTIVPVAEMRWLTERLPHCDMRVLPCEGHYSALVNYHTEILDELA